MGVIISKSESYFEYNGGNDVPERPRQVFSLAQKTVQALLSRGVPEKISHLVVATTCPDMLSPSLGQMLHEQFHSELFDTYTIDLVQGCAGGVTAMILASQLAELNHSTVMVVQADAAKKATSKSKPIHRIFGNGSYACLISPGHAGKGLLHYKSRQYQALSEVVTIRMGHDADEIIEKEETDVAKDPRKYLGLCMDNSLAVRLLRNAETFYHEFVKESTAPDVMILHQVNPAVLKHLKSTFAKYKLEFVDGSAVTGNCGAASVGIALNNVKHKLIGKKIFLCSFGTGGVITAGLWQN